MLTSSTSRPHCAALLALALLLIAAQLSAAEPVASWDAAADSPLADSSGSGHDLTPHGVTVEEYLGTPLLRTGTNQHAAAGSIGDGWEALTLHVVLLQEKAHGLYAGIIARDNYGGGEGDVFGLLTTPQDHWNARLRTSEGQITLGTPILTGWHHLALTWDGATARLYLDGKQVREASLSGQIVSEPGTPLVLGAYSNLRGWFEGGIAFAEVHDRALDAGEIATVWAQWQATQPEITGFTFAQASDVHITDTKSVEILNDGVDAINADGRIVFSLWLGDLTQNCAADEMALARMGLDRLRRQRYTLRGNHDQRDGLYEAEFGELNYTFDYAGWKFIMLDSNPGDKTPIAEERMQWLREVLAETDAEQPLVLCTHHPLAPGMSLRIAGADDVLALFAGHNLTAALCGHHHGNHEEIVDGVLYTKTACLATTRTNFDGDTRRGYRLFHCTEDGITTEFVPVRDVPREDVR